jgi:hypothetical protein
MNFKFFGLVLGPVARQLLSGVLRGRLSLKQVLLINAEPKIGNEILAYLVDHPKAQDTLEGIVEWWLLEQKIKYETARVQEALSELIAKGMILEEKGWDSQIYYRINQNKYEEIKNLSKKVR